MFFFRKIPKSRDCPWDSSPKQSQEFLQSQSRPMGRKSLGLLGLGQKSLGQSRDFELWDSNPWDKNPWDWQSRPMPIPGCKSRMIGFTQKWYLSQISGLKLKSWQVLDPNFPPTAY